MRVLRVSYCCVTILNSFCLCRWCALCCVNCLQFLYQGPRFWKQKIKQSSNTKKLGPSKPNQICLGEIITISYVRTLERLAEPWHALPRPSTPPPSPPFSTSPCLSKLSSLRMQTSARYLLTSLRYRMVALFSRMMELESVSYATSPSSVKLGRKSQAEPVYF